MNNVDFLKGDLKRNIISSPERAEGVTEKNDDFNCLEQNKPHHERNRRVFSKSKNLK